MLSDPELNHRVAFQNGEWQTGTWSVTQMGDTLAFDLTGTAIKESADTLIIQMSAQATP